MAQRTEARSKRRSTLASTKGKYRFTADEDVYRTLYELVARLVLPIDLEPALNDILLSALAVVKADGGYIRLFDLDNTEAIESQFPTVVHHGVSQAYIDYFSSLPRPVDRDARQGILQGKRLVIVDTLTSPYFAPHRKIVMAEGFRSMQATPMMSRQGTLCIGVIITCFYKAQTPPQDKLELLDLYAELAGAAIERKLMVKRRDDWQAHVQVFAAHQQEELQLLRNRLKRIEEQAFVAQPVEVKRAAHGLAEDLDGMLLGMQELAAGPLAELSDAVTDANHSYGLSSRELHVLRLIWDGMSDKQIATAIGISRYTVYKHVGSILRKMNVESRTQASILAEREGLFKVLAIGLSVVPDALTTSRRPDLAARRYVQPAA